MGTILDPDVLFRGWLLASIGARYRPWIGVLVSSPVFGVGNALTSLQLSRTEVEAHLSSQSLESFDEIIADTAAKLSALGDLDHVAETDMVMGTGIAYESGPTTKKPK